MTTVAGSASQSPGPGKHIETDRRVAGTTSGSGPWRPSRRGVALPLVDHQRLPGFVNQSRAGLLRLIPDQAQQPPPQHPPPPVGAGADTAGAAARPVVAKVVSSFTVSSWPPGQRAGSDACDIGRLTSNVLPQLRHRNS